MTDQHFTLELHDVPCTVQVTGATGTEAISGLYAFDVLALISADPGFGRRVLETRATISLFFDGLVSRTVHGIVAACDATGDQEGGRPIFLLRIVPRLARLQLRRTSRIFQDLTTREIVEQVLTISGIPNCWRLARQLPKRTYCVQYDETDYAFVTRLLVADGIYFWFEHPVDDSKTVESLILADSPAAYDPLVGAFKYRPTVTGGGGMKTEEEHIHAFRTRHAMTTTRVLLRRFDFEKPLLPRRDAATTDGGTLTDELAAMRQYVDDASTVYEHEHTREQALLESIAASTALEAETSGALTAEGETAGRRLAPGRRFRLSDHPLPELDGDYVVTACTHSCRSPQWARADEPIYRNHFAAAPASVAFRAQRTRSQVRQSIETAIVVGPKDQEIYTDEFGRVKVQFNWDLQGQSNAQSSAWLRVAQSWAGSGYGAQFLPRVGHEVLVGYIDDDADRPVVLGSLHNGSNIPPFTFPRDKTLSGIKTSTSPGGQGGHQLVFEDKAGSELVALRSNRTLALSGAEDASLGAERDMRLSTGRDRTDEVLGDSEARIVGHEHRTTGKNRHVVVKKDERLDVGGQRDTEIGEHENFHVKRWELHIVDGARTTAIGANGRDPANDQLSVSGRYSVASVDDMRLSSEKRIVLECGKSKIILLPDSIVLDSPTIQLQASDRIALLQGGGAALLTLEGSAALGAGVVSVFAGGKPDAPPTRLYLEPAAAHLDAPFIKLNCGPMGGGSGSPIDDADPKGTVTFTVEKKGIAEGIASVTLCVATPSGEIVERECPVGGTVTFEGRKGDVFTVVEARVGTIVVPIEKKSTPAT